MIQAGGKREQLARWLHITGLRALVLHAAPRRNLLAVLNYHRIGEAEATPWDPGVFSATAEQFDEQLTYVRKYFTPVTLDEAVAFARGEDRTGRGTRILITFDDGYIDNFESAFPILRSHGMQGVFYLPSSMIGSTAIPWWDAIAYMVKRARRRTFQLHYPAALAVDLDRHGIETSLREILTLYKRPDMTDSDRFIAALSEAAGEKSPAENGERLFLDWDQARQMVAGGMAAGAHTHTHRLLGRLTAGEQVFELTEGRRQLRERLGVEADTIAYPVGRRDSFTAETERLAEECGYRAAFSFYGGLNLAQRRSPYDILRVGVDGQSVTRFKVQVTAAAAVARFWP